MSWCKSQRYYCICSCLLNLFLLFTLCFLPSLYLNNKIDEIIVWCCKEYSFHVYACSFNKTSTKSILPNFVDECSLRKTDVRVHTCIPVWHILICPNSIFPKEQKWTLPNAIVTLPLRSVPAFILRQSPGPMPYHPFPSRTTFRKVKIPRKHWCRHGNN